MTSNTLPCSVLTKFDRQNLVDCINLFQAFFNEIPTSWQEEIKFTLSCLTTSI
jgi:hypothetical protein